MLRAFNKIQHPFLTIKKKKNKLKKTLPLNKVWISGKPFCNIS